MGRRISPSPDTGRRRHQVAAGATVNAVAFAPDGATLAAGGENQVIRRWDVDTGQARLALQEDEEPLRRVALAVDVGARFVGGHGAVLDQPVELVVGQLLEQEAAAELVGEGHSRAR